MVGFISFGIISSVLAERDWEYWSQESVSLTLSKRINYLVMSEWRFKDDMQHNYLFKMETGPSIKVNDYFDVALIYAYQEKKSGNMWDRSDYSYLDFTGKYIFKELGDIKLSNRFRYQYDYDKGKAILRHSFKLSKGFHLGKYELLPYFSEEPFYDTKKDRITEHRSAAGIGISFFRNVSVGLGYMFNSKRGTNKWTYANVFISNVTIKF
ncbi:MAG: DUF2490 domain-containing protein [Candidatus Omnitrophica bacterium]|nr:DUF2490 domain-containing protein [Candidatus Omnitrophota bacterium]